MTNTPPRPYRSSTPSELFSIYASPSLPTTPEPSRSHLSLSTNRDSGNLKPPFSPYSTTNTEEAFTERSAWDRDEDEKSERGNCGMRKRKAWVLLLIIVGVVVAVAVGAGVGVSMSQRGRELDAESSSAQISIEGLSSTGAASKTSETSSRETSSPSTKSENTTATPTTLSTQATTPSSTSSSPTSTTSVCPEPTLCNVAGCLGRNNADRAQLGYCTAGENSGCGCTSICGVELGFCYEGGCGGRNGICEEGDWRGCPCAD